MLAGAQVVEHAHGMPGVEQLLDDVRADETGAAGDEDHRGQARGSGRVATATLRWDFAPRKNCQSTVRLMIDVIVPALDEAEAIGAVLRAMPSGVHPIVVDNGSTDQTAMCAAAAGAEVINEPVRGFGSACHAGLRAARAEIVCFMDGDGSLDPAELSRVVRPVASGVADLCLGTRRRGAGRVAVACAAGQSRARGRAAPSHRRAADRPRADARRAPRGAAGARAARPRLRLPAGDGAGGIRAGWRIQEVPVTYRARAGGRSKVSGSVRGTARAVRDMSRLLAGHGVSAGSQPVRSVLVVDDEPTIAEVVSRYLQRAGYRARVATDGAQALASADDDPPDLVVLDLMLPRIGGLEVMRRLRAVTGGGPPIILLTAKGEESDRVIGLRLGADDYVVKPFSPAELVARVDAVLRRAPPAAGPEPVIELGEIVVDPGARRVLVAGEEATLTQREFDLLHFLASHPGQAFSRTQLMDAVWRYSFYTDTSTVTVHIRRLREKIERDPSEPRHLQTVWGVGYRLAP